MVESQFNTCKIVCQEGRQTGSTQPFFSKQRRQPEETPTLDGHDTGSQDCIPYEAATIHESQKRLENHLTPQYVPLPDPTIGRSDRL